jgi:hypothetical protein
MKNEMKLPISVFRKWENGKKEISLRVFLKRLLTRAKGYC